MTNSARALGLKQGASRQFEADVTLPVGNVKRGCRDASEDLR